MNIGLVVNAKGKLCLVHDELFNAVPAYVRYHIDRERLEIVFDTGDTFHLGWEITPEMRSYFLAAQKILLIRMEDRKPVEGYDTSFLRYRNGRPLVDPWLVGPDGFFQNNLGQIVILVPGEDGTCLPDRAVLNGFTSTLSLIWSLSRSEHRLKIDDAWLKRTMSATSVRVQLIRSDTDSSTEAQQDILLPLTVVFSQAISDTNTGYGVTGPQVTDEEGIL